MVNYCRAFRCTNRSDREKHLKYFRLPKVITNQGEECKKITEERRRLWLAKLNQDFQSKNLDNIRVCSAHFLSGKKSDLYKKDDPDWVPSVDMTGRQEPSLQPHKETLTSRYKRCVNRTQQKLKELNLCTRLSSRMRRVGVDPRWETEVTPPELTEQHRTRQKEEEFGGLESVRMAESETKCIAQGLDILEPEYVTAHSRVSNVHTDTSLIKTETDLVSTNPEGFKTESLDSTDLGYATHLRPDQIKTEGDEGGYIKAEHISDKDIKCDDIQSDKVKCESRDILVSDLMNTALSGAGVDQKDQTDPWKYAEEPNPNTKKPGKELYSLTQHVRCLNKSSKLIQNEEICTGEKPYKCNRCEKSFRHKSWLSAHQRIHTGEKPYRCNLCERSFCNKSSVRTHERRHTGEKPYKCDHCEKSFLLKYLLSSHQSIHTGEKPYRCNLCERSFCHKSSLRSHERRHKGEKPHKCNVCEKSFLFKTHLSGHKRIHTGEKPYRCILCDKSFCHKSSLLTHERRHRAEKPYKCNVCEKTFLYEIHFSGHKRIHTGERPYRCNLCERSFCHKSSLHRHESSHTSEKSYK